ncbi:Hpt domain-containing protein [Lyngbya aestuarii]|uniref:Hpt domain-containing protein n=1 Tax=Lyngbya aestuarii TaxID=118322 RepID=UPI00403DB9E6
MMIIEDEELRNLYKITSEERLQQLTTGLLHLEKHPLDETTLEDLLREAHSLKGDSRSVGTENVETLSHAVEKILGCLKQQELVFNLQVSACLYQAIDAIGLLVEEAVSGQPSGIETAQVFEQLMAVFSEPPAPESAADLEEDLISQVSVDQDSQSTIPALISASNGNASLVALTYIEDEELRNLYKTASEDRLQQLAAGLLHLEEQPLDEAILEDLLREAHSLKGDSRSVGTENVETLSHAVEEILGSLQRQELVFTPEVSGSLYQAIDAISLLVEEAVSGQPSGIETAQVLELLMAVFDSPNPEFKASPEEGNVPAAAPNYIEEELREIYKLTTEERLQKLEAGLLHLEKHPFDEITIEKLLREAHSLKGDSRSVGIETVETLTHAFEEILSSLKRQEISFTLDVSDRLYQGLDTIGILVQEAITGQASGVETAQVLEQLRGVFAESTELEEPRLSPTGVLSLPAAPPTQEISSPLGVDEAYRIDSIRVSTRQLDVLIRQAEELTLTKIRIAQATTEMEAMATLWEEWKAFQRRERRLKSTSLSKNPYEERLENLIDSLRSSAQENSTKLDVIAGELRENIRTLRLLPLSTTFGLFPRMVRDLARQQSKQVELIVEGGETTADKLILEEIKDSLMHLLRNAIDHGVETPAERERLGKSPVANIWLRGYQADNKIFIEVADDGQGLDSEKIKQTAIKRGLYSPEELETMTTSQIHALIFASGFSTRTFITEISGRGVGLDVVRTNVEQLKGNIEIESTFGQGCAFRIQLPTNLATANVLILEVQGIIHALPIEFVQTTLMVSQEQILTSEGREIITFDEQDIPVANLADLLELSNSPAYDSVAKYEQPQSNLRTTILLKVGKEQSGFFVDRLFDTQEVAIKPQSQLLKRVRNVTGATILPTGEVCTILNPSDLLKSLQQPTRSLVAVKRKEVVTRKSVILLVEDSVFVRTQEKRLLERAGYEVVVAVDGLDGYEQLKNREFDAVVSDVEMPHIDGLSLTRKIRQHSEYSHLPIILVTTLSSDEDKKRGAEAGASAYVVKGKFNQQALLEILAGLI